MEMIYREEMLVPNVATDCFGRMKLSWLLGCVQDVAGEHCARLGVNQLEYSGHRLFWAVTRHRVEITRLPKARERITLETWPCPTTRVAYPRACVAFDEAGNELFRTISLWVLMDAADRSMVLPGKSGITVDGITRDMEPASPPSIPPVVSEMSAVRTVGYTELDVNGHMNNTQYLNWVDDLLPGTHHRDHSAREFTICYLSEALEGQVLELNWTLEEGLRVDAQCREDEDGGKTRRIFAAKVGY